MGKMDELDLLKKHWKKEQHFPKVTTEALSKMIYKKSSSTVKWIFIISIIEFLLGLGAFIYMNFFSYTKNEIDFDAPVLENIINISTVLFYVVVIYFIFQFYKVYKKIKTTDNVKMLMLNILETRKIVKKYILFNLAVFFVFFMLGSVFSLFFTPIEGFDKVTWFIKTIIIFVMLLVASIGTFLFWLVYKLIYGWLLRKLDRNYKELKMIDDE